MIDAIIAVLSLLIGFVLARISINDTISSMPSKIKEVSDAITKKIEQDKVKVGPIHRPSGADLAKRNEDPKVIAEKKALLESLDKSDLRVIKDKVNELKRKGVDVTQWNVVVGDPTISLQNAMAVTVLKKNVFV